MTVGEEEEEVERAKVEKRSCQSRPLKLRKKEYFNKSDLNCWEIQKRGKCIEQAMFGHRIDSVPIILYIKLSFVNLLLGITVKSKTNPRADYQMKTLNRKAPHEMTLNITDTVYEWAWETSYLWTKAFGESLHATNGGAELNATAVQKHTQQSVGGTWIWYQLDKKRQE